MFLSEYSRVRVTMGHQQTAPGANHCYPVLTYSKERLKNKEANVYNF